VDADRQKTSEIRRLHDENKAEVARVSKEANVEIRRLVSDERIELTSGMPFSCTS